MPKTKFGWSVCARAVTISRCVADDFILVIMLAQPFSFGYGLIATTDTTKKHIEAFVEFEKKEKNYQTLLTFKGI